MSLDEFVVRFELRNAFNTEPVSHFHQLSLKRTFLIGTQMFDLNVAFVPEELLDLVDSLIIDCVNVGSVLLR